MNLDLTRGIDIDPMMVPSGRAVEGKQWNQSLNTFWNSIGTSPVIFAPYQWVAEGTEDYQRVGRVIIARVAVIDGVIAGGQSNIATDDAYNVVRLGCVLGAPGLNMSGLTVNTPADPRQFTGVVAFLWDQKFVLQSPGRDSTGYMPALKQVRKTIRLNRPLHYTSNATGTISGYDFVFYAVSDSSLVPNPGFVAGIFEGRFTDT